MGEDGALAGWQGHAWYAMTKIGSMGAASMKRELYSLVVALRRLGYSSADIARIVGRSAQRVRQILDEMGAAPRRYRTPEELPAELRTRIFRLRNASDAPHEDEIST